MKKFNVVFETLTNNGEVIRGWRQYAAESHTEAEELWYNDHANDDKKVLYVEEVA